MAKQAKHMITKANQIELLTHLEYSCIITRSESEVSIYMYRGAYRIDNFDFKVMTMLMSFMSYIRYVIKANAGPWHTLQVLASLQGWYLPNLST
jgi:hypothetical protein